MPQAPDWNIRLTFSMSGDYFAYAKSEGYSVSYLGVGQCGDFDNFKQRTLRFEEVTPESCQTCGTSMKHSSRYTYITTTMAKRIAEVDYPVCAQISSPSFFPIVPLRTNEAPVPLAELKRVASEVLAGR